MPKVAAAQEEPSLRIYKSRPILFIDNLIGGVGWGIGSVIGATVVVTVIGFMITQSQSIPFLNNIIGMVSSQLQQK